MATLESEEIERFSLVPQESACPVAVAPAAVCPVTSSPNALKAPVGETPIASVGETPIAPAGETLKAPVGETPIASVGETPIAPAGETLIAPVPTSAPCERGLPVVGVLPKLLRNGPVFLSRLARQHRGRIVELRAGKQTMFLVTHPDHVEDVLAHRGRSLGKGPALDAVRPLLGNGLVVSQGDFWLRQRRIMQPVFSLKYLASVVDAMAGAIDRETTRLLRLSERDGEIDLSPEMSRVTSCVFLESMFGTSISAADCEVLAARSANALRLLGRRMVLSFVPRWIPLPGDRQVRADIKAIDQLILGMVRDRRRSDEQRNDLLSLLLRARDEGAHEGMDDQQLRDEVVAMYVAGSETTANLLTFVWYELARHPDVDRRLRAEVRATLGDRRAQYADLANLPYMKQVILETLRLYPSIWVLPRKVREDLTVAGVHIPAGSLIMLCPMGTHYLPEYWPQPDNFDPERFAPQQGEERPRYSYYPFGGGPRQCIGNNFAVIEAQLVVAAMVQKMTVEVSETRPIDLSSGATLKPKHGLKVRLKRAVAAAR
jgi:cytochrome P450